MSRALILAGTTLIALGTAVQADHQRYKWDGTVRIVAETEACSSAGSFLPSSNEQARYHPRLGEGDPPSSFTRLMNGVQAEMIQVDGYSEGNQQFHGTGNYIIYKIGGGFFFKAPDYGEYEGSWLTFNFDQTPAVVTSNTLFVSFVGTLDNYQEIEGCTVTMRGSFSRVDPESSIITDSRHRR